MKYRKIIARHSGGPEVLNLVEENLPEPTGKNIRIKIQACGVAFADVLIREGIYPGMPSFPLTPGYDIVGIIDRIGEEVRDLRIGQRVAALTTVGGYSEYIFLPETELVVVPDELDAAEAVSLVLNYVTAYQMLHRETKLKQGDSILIHGAAGGVGTALLQLGKLMGLEMYGTASAKKHDLVRRLGGHPVDYKLENVEQAIRKAVPEGIAAAYAQPVNGWRHLTAFSGKMGRLLFSGPLQCWTRGEKILSKR